MGTNEWKHPDWEIWVEHGPPPALTAEQTELFAELERVLSAMSPDPRDETTAVAALAPVVAALHGTGLSAKRIADNSRIRPEGVERLLS